MVWPFRKEKARIRASWLASNNISTDWDNSFNKSKKELRADIEQQTNILSTHEARLKELEESLNKLDIEMTMIKEESSDPDISKRMKTANTAKLKELSSYFTRDSDNLVKAMQAIKVATNTRWLLENILNKHFTDPDRLSNPPKFEAVSWSQIFAELPEVDDLDEDYLHEMWDHYGISYSKNSEDETSDAASDIDNLV